MELKKHPIYGEISEISPGSVYGAVVTLAESRCPGESLAVMVDEFDNFFIVSNSSGRIFYEEGEFDTTLPPRSEFVELVYKARPALDGKIHRIECKCGKIADGPLFKAEKEGSTVYCCTECVPS